MILDTSYSPVSLITGSNENIYPLFSDFKQFVILPSSIPTIENLGDKDYWKDNLIYLSPIIQNVEDKSEEPEQVKMTNGQYVTTKEAEIKYRLNFRTTQEMYEKMKKLNGTTAKVAFLDFFNNVHLKPVVVESVLNFFGYDMTYFNVNTYKFGNFSVDISLSRKNEFEKFRSYMLDFSTNDIHYTTPLLSSVTISGIGASVLNAEYTLISSGGSAITDSGFYISQLPNPRLTGTKISSYPLYEKQITGLSINKTYYIVGYAINNNGESLSEITIASTLDYEKGYLTVETSAIRRTVKIYTNYDTSISIIVDWGDGVVNTSHTHTYSSDGIFEVEIKYSTSPTILDMWDGYNTTPITAIDIANLKQITSIYMYGTEITVLDISENENLIYIDARYSNLTTSGINTLLSDLVVNNKTNGTVQATRSPTGQGLTDKATLISRGWTVLTD